MCSTSLLKSVIWSQGFLDSRNAKTPTTRKSPQCPEHSSPSRSPVPIVYSQWWQMRLRPSPGRESSEETLPALSLCISSEGQGHRTTERAVSIPPGFRFAFRTNQSLWRIVAPTVPELA
ncbi:uncharacterized protein B0I36DRAFT_356274 [Microdochium trichocladiopsis]|uniref:Uncharacterized protein n=1 Tax=Microdochium trichocladiopsis TaxID=1682393 RepID=A0A9P8XTN3_9PEZI|nr:uncharacterized protein B0I36DRAFT_356274 [Microdochium trichocladiopsis]KAH7012193.1 hypothetical protein B0I36DRAFT_356274 [Microdochium trichocladiopsis]